MESANKFQKPRTNKTKGTTTESTDRSKRHTNSSKCRQHHQEKQVVSKKNDHRQKSCVCLADNYVPIQFPSIWSELRFLEIFLNN